MEEESIYNLIPREYVPPPKPPRYRSKFPPDAPPTASTFGLKTTSKVVASNLAGDYDHFDGAHRYRSNSATFGKPKGSVKPQPQTFRKKNTGTIKLPEIKKFSYANQERRPPVPRKHEAPILGLKSEKNFIVSNAVEVILQPPKAPQEPKQYLKKKDFGRTPNYLNKIKSEIEEEYDMLRQLHREQEEEMEKQRYLLSQQEAQELREGLRKKWEAVNKDYQSLTHISKIDTQGLKRRKEGCEKELAQLEKDIAMLEKQYIFVDSTQY